MASGNSRNLPAYLISDWTTRSRHALVTPATRWRVVIEDLVDVEHDVILNTVLRIRQAGERDAARISDLLQLPEDLIRYLLDAANQAGMSAKSGNSIAARVSTVGWLYRDTATGELWPQPGEQVAPTEVRYSGTFRGRFEIGTSGKPLRIDILLLDTDEGDQPEPTALELARFSRSNESNRRTAIISSGEPCLVISPVEKDKTGLAVLTTQETPHLSLGRLLNASIAQFDSVAKFARDIPVSGSKRRESSLEVVVNELDDLIDHLHSSGAASVSPEHFESQLELAIGRWVDHYRYMTGLAQPVSQPGDGEARAAAERFSLDFNMTRRWARLPKSDARRKVLELLVARLHADDSLMRDISVVTARYDSNAGRTAVARELLELAKQIAHLGRLLLDSDGGDNGQTEA